MRSRFPILIYLVLVALLPLACGERAAEETFCSPANPAPSEEVAFVFDLSAEGNRLADAAAVEMLYTLVNGRGETVTGTLPLRLAEGRWTGELTPAAKMPSGPVLMVCALLDAEDPEVFDNRRGDPWLVVFHENGAPARDADHQHFRALTGRLRFTDLLTPPKDPDRAGELLARELDNHPDNFIARVASWSRRIGGEKDAAKQATLRQEAYEDVHNWLAGWDTRGEPTAELNGVLSFLETLGRAAERDSLGGLIADAHPRSEFAESWAYLSAMRGADPAARLNGLVEFTTTHPDAADAPYARGLTLYYGQVMEVNPIVAREVAESGDEITPYLLQFYAGALIRNGDLEHGEKMMRRVLEGARAETWDDTDGEPEHVWRKNKADMVIGAMQALADVVRQRDRSAEALGILDQVLVDYPDAAGPDVVRSRLALQLQLGRDEEMLKAYPLLAAKTTLSENERADWLKRSGLDETAFDERLETIYAEARAKRFAACEKHALRYDSPAATFTDILGKPITLADLKGKVVLIDFWATWCGPCMQALPHLDAIGREYGHDGDLFIIPANTWERGIGDIRKEAVAAKWTELGMSIPYYLDADRDADAPHAVDDFGVTGIPSTFIIGPDGKLLFRKTGMAGEADIADLRGKIDYALSLIR